MYIELLMFVFFYVSEKRNTKTSRKDRKHYRRRNWNFAKEEKQEEKQERSYTTAKQVSDSYDFITSLIQDDLPVFKVSYMRIKHSISVSARCDTKCYS